MWRRFFLMSLIYRMCAPNVPRGSLPFLDKIKETVCVPPEPRTLKMTSFPAALHTHEYFSGSSKERGSTRLVWGRQARCDESFASRVTFNITAENWNVLSIRKIVFEFACQSSEGPFALIWSLHDRCSGLAGVFHDWRSLLWCVLVKVWTKGESLNRQSSVAIVLPRRRDLASPQKFSFLVKGTL